MGFQLAWNLGCHWGLGWEIQKVGQLDHWRALSWVKHWEHH